MSRQEFLVLTAVLAAEAGITVVIELTGGLPSQLVHFYYLPVVVGALRLPLRSSIIVAFVAAIAVSPVIDGFHHLAGRDAFFPEPAPWNFAPTGWIVRPVAFVAISLLGHAFVKTEQIKSSLEAVTAAQRGELTVLSRIDRMVLGGATEVDALEEIAQLAGEAMGADQAAVILPPDRDDGGRLRVVLGPQARAATREAVKDGLPPGEGVGGWALLHGKTATAEDVFSDARYDSLKDIAKQTGYRSAAAAPVVLDNEVLAAVSVSYDSQHAFTEDEIATLERIADQAAIAVANARQRGSLRRLSYETAIGLAEAIESRDPYTGDHCSRLAGYAALTAKAFGVTPHEIEMIRLGAALHDVGKIMVPDDILKKPGPLTPAEFAVIKQHCYQGGQICKRITALEEAYPIVYHHHERWDGKGYPDGIKGDRIPFGARVVAVVDAYDAMISDRPYRNAMPEEEAGAILRDGAGSQWDATVVEKFLSLHWELDTKRGLIRPAA